jgi:hypothetical protein
VPEVQISLWEVADQDLLKKVCKKNVRPVFRSMKLSDLNLAPDPLHYAGYEWGLASALWGNTKQYCPVGYQNCAIGCELGFQAARAYSLRRPPRTGRRLMCSWERSATGWSGRGGWSWSARCGLRPL